MLILRSLKFLMLPLLLSVFFSVTACNDSKPDDLIEEDRYIDLLVEMHLLAAVKEITDDEQLYRRRQTEVLEHYGIDSEQFRRSHNYYHQDMQEQHQRYREMRSRLDSVNQELTDRYYQSREDPQNEEVSEPDDIE